MLNSEAEIIIFTHVIMRVRCEESYLLKDTNCFKTIQIDDYSKG